MADCFCEWTGVCIAWRIDSFAQLLMERVETLASALQEFLVAQAAFGPTLEHLVNPGALGRLEFAVFQVRVMHHFGNSQNGFVRNAETLDQGFKRAVVSVVGE